MDLVPRLLHRHNQNWGERGLQLSNHLNNINPIATIDAISNIGKNTLDYFNEEGDFARPAKWQKTDDEQIESQSIMDSNTDQPMAIETSRMSGSGGGAAPGPKGALVGKTQTKRGYEHYFHERQWAHSKKLRHVTFLWGFSTFDQPTYTNGAKFSLHKFGSQGLTYVKEEEYIDSGENMSIWRPHYNNPNPHNKNLSDLTLACSLNLYIDDFYDKKLYDNVKKSGIFTNFNKIRLKSITVTLTPRTYWGGIKTQAQWLLARAERAIPLGGDKKFYPNYFEEDEMKELDMDYWVYRDLYGAYHSIGSDGNALLPDVPPETTSATQPVLSRTCRTIRAHDNNLESMSNRQPFSFTREVSSTGNYFISPATLASLREKPVHNLINELEGQIGTSSYINKFPEYLGLLVVPKHMPVHYLGQIVIGGDGTNKKKGYILDSSFHTILEIKYNATWECFDYKHSDYTVPTPVPPTFSFESETIKTIDPLMFAERDYLAEKELQNMQLNTN